MIKDPMYTTYTKIKNHPASPYLLLAAITLLAAALRFYKLGEWSFWVDEFYSVNRAINHFSSPELIFQNIPPERYWIPTSTILMAQVFNLSGVSEWNARLVSTLLGILSIPLFYVLINKVFGKSIALIAVLLLAISPWHIFWSQNARFYMALMILYTLALFAFHHGMERDRPLYFILFYLFFYLAMSERMVAAFLMPSVAVYLLMLAVLPIEKPPGFRLRNIFLLLSPIILFLILQIYMLITTGKFIFATDLEALPGPIDSPIRLLIVIAFSIGLPVVIMAFFSGLFVSFKKERAGLLFFINALVPMILLALLNPIVFTVDRYAFVTLLFWIVLAAMGIKNVFSIAGRPGILIAAAVFFIFVGDMAGEGLMYYQINRGNRLGWREASAFVQENKQDDDVVIATRFELASFYSGEEVVDYQSLNAKDLDGIEQTIWFIIDYPGIWHGNPEGEAWINEHATLLQFSYLRTREQNSLLIYRYDPTGVQGP
jgi:mannosyltransferase